MRLSERIWGPRDVMGCFSFLGWRVLELAVQEGAGLPVCRGGSEEWVGSRGSWVGRLWVRPQAQLGGQGVWVLSGLGVFLERTSHRAACQAFVHQGRGAVEGKQIL